MTSQAILARDPAADRLPAETAMRTSETYRAHLAQHRSCIWYGDRYHRSPLEIAAMLPQITSVGRFYDVHFEDEATTFRDAHGTSSIVHLAPTSPDELWRKGEGLLHLAGSYDGILGRAPDYVGTTLALWRQTGTFFSGEFRDSATRLADRVRQHDLYVTHTTTDITDKDGNPAGLRVVRESSAGLEVEGVRAMATAAPLSDLILMLPGRLAEGAPPEAMLIFAVPTSAPGLTLVTRQRLDGLASLSSRYEECDALVLLERVLVPWSHVFVYRDRVRYLTMTRATGMFPHASLQTAARAIAKLRTVLRLARRAEEVFGLAKRDAFKSYCGRLLRDIALLDADYQQAIERATQNAHGVRVPDSLLLEAAKLYFAQAYPRLMDDLRHLLGPELFHLFDGAALPPPLAEALGRAWGFSPAGVVQRLQLTAELFDLAVSSFGMRQELYEMHKAGTADTIARSFWKEFHPSEP
jgi:4-hydroxyphenylacetate 3-monooxygenase